MSTEPKAAPAANASPNDRALEIGLTGQFFDALRVSVAVLERDPASPTALYLTGRFLADADRKDSARAALSLAVARAIDASQIAIAIAACADLARIGEDPGYYRDAIAEAFAKGSKRLAEGAAIAPPNLAAARDVTPLDAALVGTALTAKIDAVVQAAQKAFDDEDLARPAPPKVVRHPLFSRLPAPALRAFIGKLAVQTYVAGATVIAEGSSGAEAYFVAHGRLEVRKAGDGGEPATLARLGTGALFGEMALLSRTPRAASVVTTQPSVLLFANAGDLETIAGDHPEIANELATFCRQRMVQNLVRASPILAAVEPSERARLIERFETRLFETNDVLIYQDEQPRGLHLIASGEVQVSRADDGESTLLATIGAGEVVGEMSLVLRRPATARVAAQTPTVTLFLAADKFRDVMKEHPDLLARLYDVAATRDDETRSVLALEATEADDFVLV